MRISLQVSYTKYRQFNPKKDEWRYLCTIIPENRFVSVESIRRWLSNTMEQAWPIEVSTHTTVEVVHGTVTIETGNSTVTVTDPEDIKLGISGNDIYIHKDEPVENDGLVLMSIGTALSASSVDVGWVKDGDIRIPDDAKKLNTIFNRVFEDACDMSIDPNREFDEDEDFGDWDDVECVNRCCSAWAIPADLSIEHIRTLLNTGKPVIQWTEVDGVLDWYELIPQDDPSAPFKYSIMLPCDNPNADVNTVKVVDIDDILYS